jgi:hypothetical protein
MEMIARLMEHYKSYPPRFVYERAKRTGWNPPIGLEEYLQELTKPLRPGAIIVWRRNFEATRQDLPSEKYRVVDVCLDQWGDSTPDALPLHPDMEGHALEVAIYVDRMGYIHAKMIGGCSKR